MFPKPRSRYVITGEAVDAFELLSTRILRGISYRRLSSWTMRMDILKPQRLKATVMMPKFLPDAQAWLHLLRHQGSPAPEVEQARV